MPFQAYIWSKSGSREEEVYLKVRDNIYANVPQCGVKNPSLPAAGWQEEDLLTNKASL